MSWHDGMIISDHPRAHLPQSNLNREHGFDLFDDDDDDDDDDDCTT